MVSVAAWLGCGLAVAVAWLGCGLAVAVTVAWLWLGCGGVLLCLVYLIIRAPAELVARFEVICATRLGAVADPSLPVEARVRLGVLVHDLREKGVGSWRELEGERVELGGRV